MFRLIYRQRRRILFSGILIATGMMSMAIGMSEASILWQEFETWIVVTALGLTSLVVLLLTLLTIAALIVLLPRWRLIWEQVGLLLVLHAGLLAAFPWLGDLGVLSAFLPFFIIVAVGSVLYGPALDRFRLWVDHCERRSFRSARTPEELWDNLIPNGDRIGTHWDPLLYRMEPIADEDDAFEVEYQLGHSVYEHQTICSSKRTTRVISAITTRARSTPRTARWSRAPTTCASTPTRPAARGSPSRIATTLCCRASGSCAGSTTSLAAASTTSAPRKPAAATGRWRAWSAARSSRCPDMPLPRAPVRNTYSGAISPSPRAAWNSASHAPNRPAAMASRIPAINSW